MRLIVTTVACLVLLLPVAAQQIGWRTYTDAMFGFSGAVPLNFHATEIDGQDASKVFQRMDRAQVLAYFGQRFGGEFEAQVEVVVRELGSDGWNVGHRVVTPGWSSLQAVKGQRMLDLKLIVLCDRQTLAGMHLEYSAADGIEMRETGARLDQAFVRTAC